MDEFAMGYVALPPWQAMLGTMAVGMRPALFFFIVKNCLVFLYCEEMGAMRA
jgi:hypothetical protein